jgi:hypothetical protein
MTKLEGWAIDIDRVYERTRLLSGVVGDGWKLKRSNDNNTNVQFQVLPAVTSM